MPAPTLTDGVVVLDALTPADAEAHLAAEDEEHARRFGWFPRRSTLASVHAAIERWERQWDDEGPARAFAAREASSHEVVGGCEIRLRDAGVAEMSYWTFPHKRGHGFATRVVALATQFAFERLAVARMELYIEPDNAASRAVARKAGFAEEGTIPAKELTVAGERRDMVLCARLATAPSRRPTR